MSPHNPVERNPHTRRQFLLTGTAGGLVASVAAQMPTSAPAEEHIATPPPVGLMSHRVGAVAYSFQYALGLFSYQKRSGPRMDATKFVEATHKAGGNVAQLYCSMLQSLNTDELKQLRRRAEELDVLLEIHGGDAFKSKLEATMQRAVALGVKIVGTSFGMLMRPYMISTLKDWDDHLEKCKARLRELAAQARSLGLVVAVENHLDFTVEELRNLIQEIDSPHARVLFDVGNSLGTLDDPLEAADILGPYVAATHYKDFAIDEVARGFRFTMVPLGAGSLRLPEITARLLRHVSPDLPMSIEMMNGQQFEVPWLEERFWAAFHDKPARQVAATLRHIRSKAIDIQRFRPQDEIDKLPHEAHLAFEADCAAACIAQLRQILRGAKCS